MLDFIRLLTILQRFKATRQINSSNQICSGQALWGFISMELSGFRYMDLVIYCRVLMRCLSWIEGGAWGAHGLLLRHG